jgi:N-dimethylarginine dimethylaminohydrolase
VFTWGAGQLAAHLAGMGYSSALVDPRGMTSIPTFEEWPDIPRFMAELTARGFHPPALDTSEFRKMMDGGLSCLSLRY